MTANGIRTVVEKKDANTIKDSDGESSMKNSIPNGLTTGIGSIPHIDVDSAVKFVFKYFRDIPHWPQLPKLSGLEGLVDQYLSPLINVGLVEQRQNKSLYLITEKGDWLERLTLFYSVYLEVSEGIHSNLETFSFPENYAKGFYAFIRYLETHGTGNARWLKGQISGPVTVGLQLTDHMGRSAYYDTQLRDLVVKNIAMQAIWQVKSLGRFGLPVMLFIDEPGLYAYGLSTHITLKKEDLTHDINTVAEAIQGAGALAGVHVCARTDWSALLNSKVDILSFDAFNYFASLVLYGADVEKFLQRGGVLAWGLVPTSEQAMELEVGDLIEIFQRQANALLSKGIASNLLKKQVLITPSCGTGNLNLSVAEKVYALTAGVSEHLISY